MSEDVFAAVDERARIIGVRTQDDVITTVVLEGDDGEQWQLDGEMTVVDPYEGGEGA